MSRTQAVRVVLDTNIVLSALLFAEGQVAWMRDAWQRGRIVPVVCHETVTELLRVLAYPKFKLSGADQDKAADHAAFKSGMSYEKRQSMEIRRDTIRVRQIEEGKNARMKEQVQVKAPIREPEKQPRNAPTKFEFTREPDEPTKGR